MLLVSRLARVVRQGELLKEVLDEYLVLNESDVSEGLKLDARSQNFSKWQNDVEGIKILLNLRLIPLASSPQHLSKLDSRHLCAILSSLSWMRHLILPSQVASSADRSIGTERDSSHSVSTPWAHVSKLMHRASERIQEASADDACRTLWAVAKLTGVKEMPSTAAAEIAFDDGGIFVAFARAVLRGAWEVDVRGCALLPMPGHLLPTFMWAMSHSTPKMLRQHDIQALIHRLISPSQQLPLPNYVSAQPTAMRDSSHTSSEGASYPHTPLLIQPEVLNAFSAEDLVTLLYAIGRMYGTPNGKGGGIGGQQHDKSGETGETTSTASAPSINSVQTPQTAVIEALCSALMNRCTPPSPSSRSRYSTLSPRSAANTAWALSRLGFCHPPLLRHLVVCAEGFLRTTLGLQATASPGQLPTSSFQRRLGVTKRPPEKPHRGGPETFRPQELANLMSALARLGVHAPGLVGLVELWVVRHCLPRSLLLPSREPKGSGSRPRRSLQMPSDDCNDDPGKATADRLSVRDASELLYALATMSMAPHASVLAELAGFPVLILEEPTVVESTDSPSGDSDTNSDDRTSVKDANMQREAAKSLAGVVHHALIFEKGVDGEAGRRSPLRSGGLDFPSSSRSGPSGGGHWSRPQLLIGAVWALARLGTPRAGGLLDAVVASIEDQSSPKGSSWGPKSGDRNDLGGVTDGAVGKPGDRNDLRGVTDGAVGKLAGDEDVAEPLIPLAALQPEDVARLCWTLASDGSSATEEAASGSGRSAAATEEEELRRRRNHRKGRLGALRVLETEAIEWAPSMDDQVGVQTGVM